MVILLWSFTSSLLFIWLIIFSSNNTSSFIKKTTSTALIGILSLWVIDPITVSAGFFGTQVQASTAPRADSLQTLPILENKKMSPMLLAQVEDSSPITDEDSLSAPFSIYDEENVVIADHDTVSTYVVKKGDTISDIADQFDVSANTIRWANNMPAKAAIKVGQQLTILPITGIRHKVLKGDTLVNVAKKYKSDADDVASFNGFESGEKLTVGEYIIVPNGEMNIPTEQIKPKPTKSSGSGIKITSSNTVQPVSGGYYSKPVVGGILTQGYHDQYHALDISLPRGQAIGAPILAAASGKVIVAKSSGFNGGYGLMVIIQHDNGTQTLYGHLSSVKVSVGDSVNSGDIIGGMGSTGRSTGPHLHFEVRGAITPMLYTKK